MPKRISVQYKYENMKILEVKILVMKYILIEREKLNNIKQVKNLKYKLYVLFV
jgi:hypothetical protein